jgi:hypothetical protein
MGNATPLAGSPQVIAQSIYSESSVQMQNVGALAHTNDGRAFRYCKVGATALVPGQLYQASAEDTTNFQNLTVTAPTAGDTSIVTTSTVTLTVNQLSGGLCVISTASTNLGQTFRVRGNTAATSAVTTVYLDDPVMYTPTGTTKIDLAPNPYSAVVVNPTTATSCPVGAALYKVTALYYGWLQTHGPVALLADGGITVGTSLCASNGTAGAVEPLAGVQAPIGYALTGIATGEYGLVFLTID